MKRFVILLLALVLLSAQLPASQPAYYSSIGLGPTLPDRTWKNMEQLWFSDRRDGVVMMQGQSWLPTVTGGLIELSGACTLKFESTMWVIVLNNGGTYYTLVNGRNTTTESFSVAVPASEWMQIGVYQESPHASNSIKCTLLFEPVY